ncbi:MAG: 4Fe-4S binding protein [Candidatus Helarchaeota archaeon]|nr:4Fe-4S binding protein [Candidatus Helarchaeota archaeon]
MSEKNEELERYYEILAKKLDATVFGLSPIGTQGNVSDTWMEYLRVLVDPNDVKYLIQLPVFPGMMKVKKLAKKINKSEEEAATILERLFQNDCVMRIGRKVKRYAIHLPFMIFDVPPLSYEEMPQDKARKLAKLSYKYLVDEEWYRNFEGSPDTPLSRIIPVQESVPIEQNILSHEQVEDIVKNARVLSLQKCACRTRFDFLGIRKCDHPLESCIGVNYGAQYFIDRGHAKQLTKEEALELLKKFNKMGLVHTTDNFAEGGHNLICNCCPCCCSLIGGITRWKNPRAVAKANFIAMVTNPENCTQCGTCEEKCPFHANSLGDKAPEIDSEKCMGCGICVVNCPANVLILRREEREVVYKNLLDLSFKVAKETNRKIRIG